MSQFHRSYRGNALEMLHWAYAVEQAHMSFDGVEGYGANSATNLISGMVRLGVRVDTSSAAEMQVANRSHDDAVLAHDLVQRAVTGQTLSLIIRYAIMRRSPILPPKPVARVNLDPLTSCPQKGTSQGWPDTHKAKGTGLFRSTASYSQHITIADDPRQHLRGAITAKAWLLAMQKIEADLYQHQHQMVRWVMQGRTRLQDATTEQIEQRIADIQETLK
ncbi:hypothetical protein [Thalassobius sp. Cn5-15]|uniref:hypothetical protein n=1 Tax=Thalassobius sp. Cn5-15 TaxID=2917763 RepID=UPI001EF365C3|nr:hypothetical protein [Thalassobius sp. Cn5-15]MCG7492415.1 hypothetical protein [Thalassobius sp. Cn5-15]